MKLNMGNYYKLNQLKNEVDLKERAIKYRMLYVKKKYQHRKKLLFKSGRHWNIHESILFEFDRKKQTKDDSELETQSMVTISPNGNYSENALKEVIKDTHNRLKHLRDDLSIRYYIEQGEKGKLNHIHFIVNLSTSFKTAIMRACKNLIESNIDIREVYLERNLIKYLEKEIRVKGVIN